MIQAMKTRVIFLFFVFCICLSEAQVVTCDMTLITTIGGYSVYRHNPTGAIMFRAGMAIDADGSPRAYGPNNSGLDWTANAGYPGNWWGIVTDGNGDPVIQGSGDPYPGMYVSTTSLVNSAYASNNPLRYANAETVPFYVLPSALVSLGAIHIGDMGYVYNTATGVGCYAIYADTGPAGELGEGSIYLAQQIGVNSNPRTGGTSSAIIDYIVFPQSGYGQGTIPTITQINAIGTTKINLMGGIGIAGCLDNPIYNPSNLQVTQPACPDHNITFSWANTGSNWRIDISTVSDFSSFWNKYVSNATSCLGPSGFTDHNDGVTPLALQDGMVYYWRVTNSNGSLAGPAFTITSCDVTAPVTSVSISQAWQTHDFVATYTDTDNAGGSGIEKSYYQVLDYNGAEWHANPHNGFFSDNFDTYNNTVWHVPSGGGTWAVNGGNLIQKDTANGNTNVYASLNQNLSDRYIYHFTMKLDAAAYGTGQHRFGLHYFSDNGGLTNRGNSYFIFFRQETSKLEFFKVINDTYTQEKVVDNITTVFGQWYDIKVIFDWLTGKTDVYRDGIFLSSWTDTSPLTTAGNYISFRTGNCKAYISDVNIYRSRAATVVVSIGDSVNKDIRFQNPGPSVPAGKIKSVVRDSAGNLSAVMSSDLNIDWSPPVCVTVNDGTGADIDITDSLHSLSASWPASSDPNSGISKYLYAVGTAPLSADISGWTGNGLNTGVTVSDLTLTPGQTYYFSVQAVNTAEMADTCSSDGVLVNLATYAAGSGNSKTSVFPNPFSESFTIQIYISRAQRIKITLTDVYGRQTLVTDKSFTAGSHHIMLQAEEWPLSQGIYFIEVCGDRVLHRERVVYQ